MTPTCKSCVHPCKYGRVSWCPNHTTRKQASELVKKLEKEKKEKKEENEHGC